MLLDQFGDAVLLRWAVDDCQVASLALAKLKWTIGVFLHLLDRLYR